MPELPEVETTVRGIKNDIINQEITNIKIYQDKCRLVPGASLQAQIGTTITAVERKAKYVLLLNATGRILIHLGMSGYLRVVDVSQHQRLTHDHVEIYFGNGKVLVYNDQRRFGGVTYEDQVEFCNSKYFKNLGPDALSTDFDVKYLHDICAIRKAPIKKLLMDNKFVVGVGNIYANEALFAMGINPLNSANTLTKEQITGLVATIKKILLKSIEVGGTTLRDFQQPDGKPGYFVQQLQVYGHEGKYLEAYDDYVIRYNLAGRSCFICLKKQPLVGTAIEAYQGELQALRDAIATKTTQS